MKLELAPVFQRHWKDKDPFVEAEQLQGEVFRELEARRTLRFKLEDKSYFIKIHRGVGWFEILENLLRLRLPVLGARNEYEAIRRLETLNIDTMSICAYAEKGLNPARRKSFIITEDLVNTISLEDFCLDWHKKKPDFRLKKALIEKLALVSRLMHNHGINHRDYYICHFLLALPLPEKDGQIAVENLKVSLIDLHRAQLRSVTPQRWRIKDIASLYFSAMNIGLTKRDVLRFVRVYQDNALRHCLKNTEFWQQVSRRADKLMDRKQRKGDLI